MGTTQSILFALTIIHQASAGIITARECLFPEPSRRICYDEAGATRKSSTLASWTLWHDTSVPITMILLRWEDHRSGRWTSPRPTAVLSGR